MISQVFASARTAAEALATAIDSDPGSVFVTLVKHKVHGKALNIEILGPSQAASAGSGLPACNTLWALQGIEAQCVFWSQSG